MTFEASKNIEEIYSKVAKFSRSNINRSVSYSRCRFPFKLFCIGLNLGQKLSGHRIFLIFFYVRNLHRKWLAIKNSLMIS